MEPRYAYKTQKSKKWSHVGVVVGLGRYRDYRIKFASGSVLWRNRRFLRPIFSKEDGEINLDTVTNSGAGFSDGDSLIGGSSDVSEPGDDHTSPLHSDTPKQSDESRTRTSPNPPPVRRSDRIRKKKVIFDR